MENKTLKERMFDYINDTHIEIYGYFFCPENCTREQADDFFKSALAMHENLLEGNNWEENEETEAIEQIVDEYNFNSERWAAFEAQREQTEEKIEEKIEAAQSEIEECAKNGCHLNNCERCQDGLSQQEREEIAKNYPVSLLTIYQDPSVLPQFRGWTQKVVDVAYFQSVEAAYMQQSIEMKDGHECLHYQVVDTITHKHLPRPIEPLTEAQKNDLKSIPF